jgi:hypothetical protein
MGTKKPGNDKRRPRPGRLTREFDIDPRDSYAAARILALVGAFEMEYFLKSEKGVFYADDENEKKKIY